MGVVEMGMNHPGEIAGLAAMTQPSVALVLNAQREHQEFMDGPEATARENGTVFDALPAGGAAVFPGDDPCTPIWQALAQGHRVLNFGLVADEAALQADAPSMAEAGAPHLFVAAARDARPEHFRARLGEALVDIRLNIAGRHSVRNALAAAACTLALGVPVEAIVRGLAAFEPVNGRLRRTHTVQGVSLIDDTYNANPDSMRAAIDVLADQPAPRLLVMGDMGETGAQAEAFHREVGEYAVSRAIEQVWAVGKDMKAAAQAGGVQHWETVEALLAEHPQAPAGIASILVKGSRFMKMERVVRAWADMASPQGEH